MSPKSLTSAAGWLFHPLGQRRLGEETSLGKVVKNQILVLNITTLRPIQDFYIQIPH